MQLYRHGGKDQTLAIPQSSLWRKRKWWVMGRNPASHWGKKNQESIVFNCLIVTCLPSTFLLQQAWTGQPDILPGSGVERKVCPSRVQQEEGTIKCVPSVTDLLVKPGRVDWQCELVNSIQCNVFLQQTVRSVTIGLTSLELLSWAKISGVLTNNFCLVLINSSVSKGLWYTTVASFEIKRPNARQPWGEL